MLKQEQIKDYLKTLEKQKKELEKAIESHTITLHAVLGGIQAAQYLLSLSEQEENKGEGDEK